MDKTPVQELADQAHAAIAPESLLAKHLGPMQLAQTKLQVELADAYTRMFSEAFTAVGLDEETILRIYAVIYFGPQYAKGPNDVGFDREAFMAQVEQLHSAQQLYQVLIDPLN